MEELNYFEIVIKKHLDEEAAKDPTFAEKYTNEQKTIKGCCDFIIKEVQKSGRNGFDDAEIYGLAKHYYDEEDIDAGENSFSAKVVINEEIQLSDEEIKRAKTVAFNKYVTEEETKLRLRQTKKKKEETTNDGQLFLF